MKSSQLESIVASLPVHVILMATVVIVSLIGMSSDSVKRALILHPYRVRHDGHVHRLLTAGWLHGDFAHLAFNMITLYFFAGDVLRVLGPVRFLALYLSAVVMGFVPTTLRYMNKQEYSSLGASGAVAAVIFSAILLVPNLKMFLMFLPIPVPGIVFALAYLVYSFWHSRTASDGVNHDAHFFGALYGAMFTYAFEPARVERTIKSFF
jgi:membrane associated rhomboid family serine protease